MKPRIPAGARPAASFGEWTLYELPLKEDLSTSTFLWQPFKLMLPVDTCRKRGSPRVFWLYWNPVSGRLRRDHGAGRLNVQDPDLYAKVVFVLQVDYGRDWLLSEGGVTDEEIAAEMVRVNGRHRSA